MKIAIIGAGQLAKMLAEAGIQIGHTFTFLANVDEDIRCINGLGDVVRKEENIGAETIFKQLGYPDVVTVEREQVDISLLTELEKLCPVHPSTQAIAFTQNRIKEKTFLDSLDIPIANYSVANNREELNTIVESSKRTVFIKHPYLGYDGKSQWKVSGLQDLNSLSFPNEIFPLVVEESVEFICEASLIGVRSEKGEIKYYAPTKNYHRDGILIHSSLLNEENHLKMITDCARDYIKKIFEASNYVGVLTLELFVTQKQILVNEIAPRVHNSGHWTMDGCESSQFENHIRAITGMSLGDIQIENPVGMVNLLGVDSINKSWNDNVCKVYWYNKSVKPKRKMGHVNFLNTDDSNIKNLQEQLVKQLYGN